MFDGNFRSPRDVRVNGTRRRRTATQNGNHNKASILQHAEAQRKERQAKLRRDRAARLIQRHSRGYMMRRRLCLQTLSDSSGTPLSYAQVSMCLSLLNPSEKAKVRDDFLWRVATEWKKNEKDSSPNQEIPMNDDDEENADQMDISQHVDTNHSTKNHPANRISKRRIVIHLLQTLVPLQPLDHQATSSTRQRVLFALLQDLWPDLSMDDDLFLQLATCFAAWWLTDDDKNSTTNESITLQLSNWSSMAAASQLKSDSSPIMATALLASVYLSCPNSSEAALQGLPDLFPNYVESLGTAIQSIVDQQENDPSMPSSSSSSSHPLQAALEANLFQHKHVILSNLVDLSIPPESQPTMVGILHYTLMNSGSSSGGDDIENDDLALSLAWLARGESLEQKSTPNNKHDESAMDDWSDDESDDDDSDGEDNRYAAHSSAVPRGTRISSSGRQLRKSLSTVVKLDKQYKEAMDQHVQEDVLPRLDSPTKALAIKLSKTIPWVTWGIRSLEDEERNTGQTFVNVLAVLLQTTTGLKAQSRVSLLSPLAFSKRFMILLWGVVVDDSSSLQQRTLTLGVFCDLFGHYLVALSDADFVKYHTPTTDHTSGGSQSTSTTSSIPAKEIIERLGTALHEVYWTKPVTLNEVVLDKNHRGRLFLSGTKVWNSLYERWNRLVRVVPFCNEETWWFPHLSSREGDGAVVPARERPDDQAMEIDDAHTTATADTDALADAFRDPKMARVLTSIPQALPFSRRVKLFQSLLKADKRKTMQAASNRRSQMADDDDLLMFIDGTVRERVRIRRAKLYEDSKLQLNELGPKLKHMVQVSFINQHGAEEAGIDGGGVFKEFLDDLIKDGFMANEGEAMKEGGGSPHLFSITPLQTLAVNFDNNTTDSQMLEHYEFLGRVLGKAVYESILVEPQFCLPFLNQLLAKTNTMEDMKNFDEEYYVNLSKLRTMNEEDVDSLSLTFEISVGSESAAGSARTIELFPGGRNSAVTKKNVFQYMHMVAHQLLNVQGARQTRAFLRGFRDLIPASWVRLFSANELQKLISGDDSVMGIDVPSLQQATEYLGGYHPSQPYIQDFWEVLEHDLTPEQQRKFLRFMTSCSRQPLLGFQSLYPAPSIQQIHLRGDEPSKNSKLPTSQTCMNLLKLPNYKNRQLLKEKLIAAIESGAGFELT